jgi:hypothetical protein
LIISHTEVIVKPFPLKAAGIFLSGALALVCWACGKENLDRSAETAPPAKTNPAAKENPAAPPVNQLTNDAAAQKSCEMALDIGAVAEVALLVGITSAK